MGEILVMHDDITDVMQADPELATQLLDNIKTQMHERSERAGYLIDLGEIRQDTDFGLWIGKTSVAERLKIGEITEHDISDAFNKLSMSYVPVTIGAAKRCVEDRSIVGFDDNDPRDVGMPLGPQVQGGTVDEALAHRLANGYTKGDSLINDVNVFIENNQSKFAPGAHFGSHANALSTDCGSVENERPKTALYNNIIASPVIESKVQAIHQLAGKELNPDVYSTLQKNAADLESHGDEYFSPGPVVLETVKDANPDGVIKVQGDHLGAFVVVNLVENETLHTGNFNSLTGDKIYAFNLDAWNIFAENPDQEAANLFAGAISTLMRITDGTVRLVARLPNDKADISETK